MKPGPQEQSFVETVPTDQCRKPELRKKLLLSSEISPFISPLYKASPMPSVQILLMEQQEPPFET